MAIELLRRNEDQDAVEIGELYRKANELYRKAKVSIIDSVRWQVECGRRLVAKKDLVGHGNWLMWLRENEPVLGFGERCARMLIRHANRKLAADLTEVEALEISRETWGHLAPVRGNCGTGSGSPMMAAGCISVPKCSAVLRRAKSWRGLGPATNVRPAY
jgi:hypothetical protein